MSPIAIASLSTCCLSNKVLHTFNTNSTSGCIVTS